MTTRRFRSNVEAISRIKVRSFPTKRLHCTQIIELGTAFWATTKRPGEVYTNYCELSFDKEELEVVGRSQYEKSVFIALIRLGLITEADYKEHLKDADAMEKKLKQEERACWAYSCVHELGLDDDEKIMERILRMGDFANVEELRTKALRRGHALEARDEVVD